MTASRKTKEVGAQLISKATIRSLATAESFARGRSYFDDGAVSDVRRRGDQVTAEVEGSEFEPYQVSIRLHGGGVADAHCSCPYDWGGYCKHIVAVLLKLADANTKVIERKTLTELLPGSIALWSLIPNHATQAHTRRRTSPPADRRSATSVSLLGKSQLELARDYASPRSLATSRRLSR